ncbi:MAG: EF-P lysine aminoacylase GenX [Gammaproteobacteria bacterium]|nr:EF-P lysine aminoacylase GenX [Gammaproteobacteria bacterium]
MKRSHLFQQVRAFFYARSVIEVDTPMLSKGAVPDVHLASLSTWVQVPGERDKQRFYLPTSPEYPMKRMLCEGSGDIFSLAKVFRDGDLSPRHQVEFIMLEWYRLGFSLFELMAEVTELLQLVLADDAQTPLRVESITYQGAFKHYAGIDDVFTAASQDYQACLNRHNVPEIVGLELSDRALWEQLVFTEVVEPKLGISEGSMAITLLYHYPASQSALAQISQENPLIAERFEVFVNGMELANGYHELADAEGYRQRFEASLTERVALKFETVPLDKALLSTLASKPLPDCSGVALGLDRLFALQQGFEDIEQGIAFGLADS